MSQEQRREQREREREKDRKKREANIHTQIVNGMDACVMCTCDYRLLLSSE